MIRRPVEHDPAEERTNWQILRWRMNVHRVTPQRLAEYAEYPIWRIERGLRGQPATLTDEFLRHCVSLFGLTSGRNEGSESASDSLTRAECIDLLKPPKAMPPQQVDFWKNPDILNDD